MAKKMGDKRSMGGVIGKCLFMIFPGKPFKHTLSSSVMLTTKHFNVAYSSYSLIFVRTSKLIHMWRVCFRYRSCINLEPVINQLPFKPFLYCVHWAKISMRHDVKEQRLKLLFVSVESGACFCHINIHQTDGCECYRSLLPEWWSKATLATLLSSFMTGNQSNTVKIIMCLT
jgi:hypothetical protein